MRFIVLAATTLVLAFPAAGDCQAGVAERLQLQRAALAGLADAYAAWPVASHAKRTMVFDSTPSRFRLNVAAKRTEYSIATPRPNSPAKDLAAALRAPIAAGPQLERCQGAGPTKPCTLPIEIVVVRVGEPIVTADSATVLIEMFANVPAKAGWRVAMGDRAIAFLKRSGSAWAVTAVKPACVVVKCESAGGTP